MLCARRCDDLPVLDTQPGNPREFPRIVCHQRQAIGDSNSGNQQVMGPDYGALSIKVCANGAVCPCSRIIEDYGTKTGEELVLLAQRIVRRPTLSGAKRKLRANYRAHQNVLVAGRIDAIANVADRPLR